MKSKKRYLIFTLLTFFCVNLLPVGLPGITRVKAVGTTYVDLNFDAYDGSTTAAKPPSGWSIYNVVSNKNYVVGEAVSPRVDKSMKFYTSIGGKSMSLAKTKLSIGSANYNYKVVFQASLYFLDTNLKRTIFDVQNGSLSYVPLITFDADGSIKINSSALSSVTLEQKYEANTWYNIRIFLDAGKKATDVYINGTRVAENIPLPSGWDGSLPNTIKVTQHATNTDADSSSLTGTMYFDDFKIYDFIPVSDIALVNSSKVPIGSQITLTPTISPTEASDKSVTWTSSDPSVATVDDNGIVSGIKPGNVVITATTVDGNKSAECSLEVQSAAVPVEGVSIEPNIEIFIGQTVTLNPVITPSEATNKAVTFTSSDTSIVQIDNSSTTSSAIGIKEGTAVITVTTMDGNKTASSNVKVKHKPVDNITMEEKVTVQKGKLIKLTPVISPEDASNKNIVWTSSNANIAFVDNLGRVRGVESGSADITAATEDGSKFAVCRVEVTPLVYANDEYDRMRSKWKDTITGGDYDQNDPLLNTIVGSLGGNAKNLWDTMNKSADRIALWNNIPAPTQSAPITTSYKNLLVLARAFTTKGSGLYGNMKLLNDIVDGLDWMYKNMYHEDMKEYGNWWDFEIGTPIALNDITVLLYDYLSNEQIENYMGTIYYFQPDPDKSGLRDNTQENVNRKTVGANRIDVSKVAAVRGIIVKDAGQIAAARDALSDVMAYVTKGDGFYKDGSFIQHETVPYTGTYGNVLISGLGALLNIMDNTTWEPTDPVINNVYDVILNSFEPLMYKGAMMDMVRGRAISRPKERDRDTGHGIINSIIQLASSAPEPYASKFKSLAKYMMQVDTNRDHLPTTGNLNAYKNAKAVLEDDSIIPRGEINKHYIFPNMDRAVHHGNNFAFGISMFSNRITNFEMMNGENLNGWYTSSGMTYLYNNDLAQYSEDFWPTVNPYRLPGTTVDTAFKNSGIGMKKLSTKSWIGGTSILGLYGATGMELQDVETSLTARKSWFNFDDEVVALGSGINSTDNRSIETTIENRKLNDAGDNTLTVDGIEKSAVLGWSEDINGIGWAHLRGNVAGADIGYYFPNLQNVKALRESRTGNWSDIGSTTNLPDTTKNYLTMWFDHGQNPVDATYEYVILPNKTSEETAAYANAPNISIIKNTNEVQAVKENKLNVLAANFWTDSVQSVDYITVNKKASIISQIADGYLEIAISDPTMENTGTIEIDIDKVDLTPVNLDSRIAVSQINDRTHLSVNVADSKGESISAKFRVTPSPVTPELPKEDIPPVVTPPVVTPPTDITLGDMKRLESALADKDMKVVTVAVQPGAAIVDKSIFTAIKGMDKIVTFNNKGADGSISSIWSFDGKKITNNIVNIDLTIKFASPKQEEIESIAKTDDIFVISFNHHGDLPGTAKISVKADPVWLQGKDRNDLSLYYFNPNTKTLELVTESLGVDDNGFVTFELNHNSDYVLLDNQAAQIINANNAAIANASKLVDDALKLKTFYHYNIAYYEVLKLSEDTTKSSLLNKLSLISNFVWTTDIKNINKMIDDMVSTASGQIYDEIQLVINNANIPYIDKAYLLGEVTSWGKKLVWTTDYSLAVDSVVDAWINMNLDSITKADSLIKQLKNQYSKDYLLEELSKIKEKHSENLTNY